MPATRYVTWSSTVSGKTIILFRIRTITLESRRLETRLNDFARGLWQAYLCVNFQPNVIRRNIIPNLFAGDAMLAFLGGSLMRRPYKVTKQELRSLRLINWVKFNFGKSSLSSDSRTLKHCYFRPLCLPVKKASKTVIRPIRRAEPLY